MMTNFIRWWRSKIHETERNNFYIFYFFPFFMSKIISFSQFEHQNFRWIGFYSFLTQQYNEKKTHLSNKNIGLNKKLINVLLPHFSSKFMRKVEKIWTYS